MRNAHLAALLLAVPFFALLSGCEQSRMRWQPKYKAYSASSFFQDGASARPPVPGTVARPRTEPVLTGTELLARGKDRYLIFCTPCHSTDGSGDGPVTHHGFPKPPRFQDLSSARLDPREIERVVREGSGSGAGPMPSYASKLPPTDRRAVAVYVRELARKTRAKAREGEGP